MIRTIFFASAIFLSACSSHHGHPDTPRTIPIAATSVTVVRDVLYTPANWPQALAADLYRPSGAGPFPAVLMIHGGGWEGRSRQDMDSISQQVAKHGYVVMNVSYRFAPRWNFPAQLNDIQQALLWLRAHAADQSVDTDRVGVWGYSAGAHLAALLGVTGPTDKQFVQGARVQAVVAGGTPVDVRYYKNGALVKGLMGVSYDENPDLWRDASPLALVTADDPPVFLYHGTFDFTVSDSNAHAMYDALNSAKVPTELYLMHGLEHLSTFVVDSPVESAIEFLDRHLRLQPSATRSSALHP